MGKADRKVAVSWPGGGLVEVKEKNGGNVFLGSSPHKHNTTSNENDK
jgi:hypothetical protein